MNKNGFGIKYSTMVDMPENQTNLEAFGNGECLFIAVALRSSLSSLDW